MEVSVNYLAVLFAGLSTMVVGSIFYNPKVLGTMWMKLAHVKPDRKMSAGQMAWMYGSVFVASLVTAFVLAHVSFLSNSFFHNSFLQDTLTTAFWLWLGFTILRIYTHDTFEGRRKKLTFLSGLYELITVIAMGLIIGLMGV